MTAMPLLHEADQPSRTEQREPIVQVVEYSRYPRRSALDGLARVVWCRVGSHERYRAGLAVLRDAGERPMLRVRRPTGESPGPNRTLGSR